MNATDLLEKQHRIVEQLFEKLESNEDDGKVGERETRKLVEELANNLAAHQVIEETIFYPAVKKALDEDGRAQVLESFEEHALAKVALMRLLGTPIDDESFDARVLSLKQLIEHHVDEEEEELFPNVEETLDEDALEAMGKKMEVLFEATHAKGYAAVMAEDPIAKTRAVKAAKANGARHERADR